MGGRSVGLDLPQKITGEETTTTEDKMEVFVALWKHRRMLCDH